MSAAAIMKLYLETALLLGELLNNNNNNTNNTDNPALQRVNAVLFLGTCRHHYSVIAVAYTFYHPFLLMMYFNGYFPGKLGLTGCPVDSFSPVILILSITT